MSMRRSCTSSTSKANAEPILKHSGTGVEIEPSPMRLLHALVVGAALKRLRARLSAPWVLGANHNGAHERRTLADPARLDPLTATESAAWTVRLVTPVASA